MATTIDKAAVAAEDTMAGKKPKREPLQENFKTADEAVKAAADRVKGPRRAFKCTSKEGKDFFVVANNEGRAAGVTFLNLGGKVEEIGKTKKVAKPASLTDVLATLDPAMMDPKEKEAIVAQLRALGLVK